MIDRAHPEEFITVRTSKVGKIPFDTNGAPVVLEAWGRQIPEWKMAHHSAGETPMSPVTSEQSVIDLELIPYGSTRLRITEFPVVKAARLHFNGSVTGFPRCADSSAARQISMVSAASSRSGTGRFLRFRQWMK